MFAVGRIQDLSLGAKLSTKGASVAGAESIWGDVRYGEDVSPLTKDLTAPDFSFLGLEMCSLMHSLTHLSICFC